MHRRCPYKDFRTWEACIGSAQQMRTVDLLSESSTPMGSSNIDRHQYGISFIVTQL